MIEKFEVNKTYYVRYSLDVEDEDHSLSPIVKTKCTSIVEAYPYNSRYAYMKIKGTGDVMFYNSNVYETEEEAKKDYIENILSHIEKLKQEIKSWETFIELGCPD